MTIPCSEFFQCHLLLFQYLQVQVYSHEDIEIEEQLDYRMIEMQVDTLNYREDHEAFLDNYIIIYIILP